MCLPHTGGTRGKSTLEQSRFQARNQRENEIIQVDGRGNELFAEAVASHGTALCPEAKPCHSLALDQGQRTGSHLCLYMLDSFLKRFKAWIWSQTAWVQISVLALI